ncbi:tyrosine-type recombinase/integrase [Aurantimonas sp. MSK8Z-1]|uniref:tyrosine-type recombinase/integrase n=1 Tax=Mangrovibrevibacter kandeliae TaxID=2968473 RepID=UPI002117D4D3|nr:tyrosine-type recombinase/integrase [Aurantimonas sp. MSK8Z-1]MCW4114786.1 tyrosine-type recombinase/integrase [Aurantimonas sp. MSK8Z-1]
MPRPRPPYLQRETTRHGTVVWYVRKGDGPRIRIKGDYGTPAFVAAYEAALHGAAAPAEPQASSASLAWLIERYRESAAWKGLSAATRRQRENIFRQIGATAGAGPYRSVTKAIVTAGRDRRADTPAQARNFLDALRGLFRWALEAGKVKVDPTAGVKNPARRPGAEGFPVWTEADVEAYEARWPLGTRQRVWLDVLLYTGLRRGDAVRLGRQHVSGGVATIRTEKSQFTVEVTIPILPVLAATLQSGPCGDLAFICGERGTPLTKETFGNDFRAACRAAGVKKSAHGVRKIGATRAANAGATVSELEALFGWQGGAMASLYTRAADRRRLAKGAIAKLNKNAS